MREKNGRKLSLFYKDPEAAFGSESATRGGSKRPELDGEKPWRRQVFGARMRERNGRKLSLSFKDPEGRLAGSFWTRIRWGKAVAVPGVLGQKRRLVAKVRPGEARFGPELDGEKPWRRQVFGARMRERNRRKLSLFYKDPEAAFGSESATRGGSFGPELDGEKLWRRQVFGARMDEKKWKKTSFVL